jgi:mitochondrial fission protein ELM1
VSDGRAGNAAQVRAITQALGETHRWMQIAHINGEAHQSDAITLSPGKPWTWLPSKYWAAPLFALPKEQRHLFGGPFPTIWLGAGGRTAPYSVQMRALSAGKTITVHILDPQIAPEAFDLLVTPAHDNLAGPNVISTTGSPAYFSADDIEAAGHAFANLADEVGKSAIVVLGGNSKTHTFTEDAANRLIGQLKTLNEQGWRLRITASRRTPVEARAKFRNFAETNGARYWEGPQDGPNPYLAWLIFADVAIVTEDSSNMLSDAAYHGLPIHITELEGNNRKFSRLHDSFIDHGCARWFDGTLDTWEYAPLREADRVADEIVKLLLNRYPQPDLATSPGKIVAPDWL